MVITKATRGRPSRVSIWQAVDDGISELRRIGGLPGPEAAADIWRGIWFEETHHSTAIEGNTLILDRFLLPALAGPLQVLPLSALARPDLTPLALRRAAQKGRLEAIRRPGAGTARSRG